MNNKTALLNGLTSLDLDEDQARVYIELLEDPRSHLALSRSTGINRSKVYRVVDSLIARGLVSRRQDDRGSFLTANNPRALTLELAVREEEARQRRMMYEQILPDLSALMDKSSNAFTVRTYDGIEGLKQMQWNELSTQGELLVFGNIAVEQLGITHMWAENFRMHTVERGYSLRELFNTTDGVIDFTDNTLFMELYDARILDAKLLPLETPMIIYNDTVAIYQFDDEHHVGVEVINAAYATTMRRIFDHYWRLGVPLVKSKNTS